MKELLLLFATLLLLTSSFQVQGLKPFSDVNVDSLVKLRSIVRTIDGSNNNLAHPAWGQSWTNFARKAPNNYEDGFSIPRANMPNPRFLSESLSKLEGNVVIPNKFNLTMLFGTWGQFLDHDITLSGDQPV